jgi:putative membrane protein
MPPDYVWWSPMWFFPLVIPVIMLVAMVLCLYFIFGRGGFKPPWHHADRFPDPGGPASDSALDILKKRYARGEISKAEFEQMRRDILT